MCAAPAFRRESWRRQWSRWAVGVNAPGLTAQTCAAPYQVSPRRDSSGHERPRRLQSHDVKTHGNTVRGRGATGDRPPTPAAISAGAPSSSLAQTDWFAAHLATAGVTYADMSESARAAFEHHQDFLVDYGPQVVDQVVEGSEPIMALDVTLFRPDSEGAASGFSYKDTLSVPQVDVYDDRLIPSSSSSTTTCSCSTKLPASRCDRWASSRDLRGPRQAGSEADADRGHPRPVAGHAGTGEDVPRHLEDRHCHHRAGRARARAHPMGPAGLGHPCRANETAGQASLRRAFVSGSAENTPP